MRIDIELSNLNKKECARYLGYTDSEVDKTTAELMQGCEDIILEEANPRCVYRVFDIEKEDSVSTEDAKKAGILLSGTNMLLTGNSIKTHLAGCEKVILLAATLSDSIDRKIRFLQATDMAQAVVMDAMAGVAVEQICDKAEKLIADEWPGLYMTFRFGIGYGDLPIQLQENFIKVIQADKMIGLNVTKSCMLTPTKSVTAIIGLSKNKITGIARGCGTCNINESCKYRAKGIRCYE